MATRISKALVFHNQRILLLLPTGKQKYHLPGGHVEPSETFSQGLLREVKEETGLPVTFITEVEGAEGFKLFICKVAHANVKLSDEHTSYIWINPRQALKDVQMTKETFRDISSVIKKSSMYRDYVPAEKSKENKSKKAKKAINTEDE